MPEKIIYRDYQPEDYSQLKGLYGSWFDAVTDAEDRINAQQESYPGSIVVVEEANNLVGSATFLPTPRLALFFRVVVAEGREGELIPDLIKRGKQYFAKLGYQEVHIIAPEEDLNRRQLYESLGFQTGNPYRWFYQGDLT